MRDHATEGTGITLGPTTSIWNRYVAPTADDSAARALVFGGYRLRNDIAVEASFNSIDQYALRPDIAGGPQGCRIELRLELRAGRARDSQLERRRVHELDVLPFAWPSTVALAMARAKPFPRSARSPCTDSRRSRDGVNVGVGLRYDMNSSLGLRVEYARFGRFAGEIGTGLPETDQVSFGVQLRF